MIFQVSPKMSVARDLPQIFRQRVPQTRQCNSKASVTKSLWVRGSFRWVPRTIMVDGRLLWLAVVRRRPSVVKITITVDHILTSRRREANNVPLGMGDCRQTVLTSTMSLWPLFTLVTGVSLLSVGRCGTIWTVLHTAEHQLRPVKTTTENISVCD